MQTIQKVRSTILGLRSTRLTRRCESICPVLIVGALAAATLASAAPAHKAIAPPATQAADSAVFGSPTHLMTHAENSSDMLHIVIGRSTFIQTSTRLKRVYVSNPEAIESFAASPYQLVISAKAPGVSSVILWDEAQKSQLYLVSADVDVESLRQSIHQALPGEDIKVEAHEGRISLFGTASNSGIGDTALKLASLYSKEVSDSVIIAPEHIKQVRLKLRIVEIDRSRAEQFGINLFKATGNYVGSSGTGQFPSTATYTAPTATTPASIAVSDPLSLFLYSFSNGIGATIKDLENKQVLQILAEPTITTVSGQKAAFLSGGEFPFPIVQGGTANSTAITIQFRPYGVKVDFTPVVTPEGTIQLKVAPEVSALDYTNAVTVSGYTIPALSTRKAETNVELRDGQSFAISGLLDHRTTDAFGKMPGIASVPILGELFKSKSINHSVVELVVIVTPTIVDPLTDHAKPVDPIFALPTLTQGSFDQKLGKLKDRQP